MLRPAELVLPHTVELTIPGFLKHRKPGCFAQLPVNEATESLFTAFVARVLEAIGRRYLPVCRLSDGEFLLLFGPQPMPPSIREQWPLRCEIWYAKQWVKYLAGGFRAATAQGVSSGAYTHREVAGLRAENFAEYQWLARQGVLAVHLEFGPKPFQENYFAAIRRWIDSGAIMLTALNYVPFYFVYAMLMGPERRRVLTGRRIVVVHSAAGEKRQRICQSLAEQGAASVQWIPISAARSFFDTIELRDVREPVDICLIGAGVGKARILKQLEGLQTACIDAGYCFEVWADAARRWHRPFMVDDVEDTRDRTRE